MTGCIDWVLSYLPLSFVDDGSGAGSSGGPRFDLNGPPSEPAPPLDPRAVEDENLRLRQENAELSNALKEELQRLKAALELAEQELEKAKEQDRHRQEGMEFFQRQHAEKYCRLKKKGGKLF